MIKQIIVVFAILLFIKTAYAQDTTQITTGILRAILGELPAPCSDLSSATCSYCVTYLKILPFVFFFGFFYMMFFIGLNFAGREIGKLSSQPSAQISIIIISTVLSIMLLHTDVITSALSRLKSFHDWIGWASGVVTFVLFRFLFEHLWNIGSGIIPAGPTRNIVGAIFSWGIPMFIAGYAAFKINVDLPNTLLRTSDDRIVDTSICLN